MVKETATKRPHGNVQIVLNECAVHLNNLLRSMLNFLSLSGKKYTQKKGYHLYRRNLKMYKNDSRHKKLKKRKGIKK